MSRWSGRLATLMACRSSSPWVPSLPRCLPLPQLLTCCTGLCRRQHHARFSASGCCSSLKQCHIVSPQSARGHPQVARPSKFSPSTSPRVFHLAHSCSSIYHHHNRRRRRRRRRRHRHRRRSLAFLLGDRARSFIASSSRSCRRLQLCEFHGRVCRRSRGGEGRASQSVRST